MQNFKIGFNFVKQVILNNFLKSNLYFGRIYNDNSIKTNII